MPGLREPPKHDPKLGKWRPQTDFGGPYVPPLSSQSVDIWHGDGPLPSLNFDLVVTLDNLIDRCQNTGFFFSKNADSG